MIKITVKGILDSKTASQLKLENQPKRFAQVITLQQDEYLRLPVSFQNKIKNEQGDVRVLDLTQISLATFALDLGEKSLHRIGSRVLITDPTKWSTQRDFVNYCIELDKLINFNAYLIDSPSFNINKAFNSIDSELNKILPHVLFAKGSDDLLLSKLAEQGLTIAQGDYQYENSEKRSNADANFEKLVKSNDDGEFDSLFASCTLHSIPGNGETVKYSMNAISVIKTLETSLRKKYWGAIKNSFGTQIDKSIHSPASIDLPSSSNPSFITVTDKLHKIISIAKKYGSQPKIRPILLVGAPGCGKTKFAKRLARAFSDQYIYIPSNARSSGFLLSGLDITWKNSQPGEIARAVIATPSEIIPVIVDEIDKASDDIIAPLYQLLEKESASLFIDEFLKFPIDASNVFFIATANSIDQMNPAILDRFSIVNCIMHSPTIEDCSEIMNEIKTSYGLPENVQIDPETFQSIISAKASYRQIYEAIENYLLENI